MSGHAIPDRHGADAHIVPGHAPMKRPRWVWVRPGEVSFRAGDPA